MGLSASQARFLQLTARKNDIEYQAQQISQERLSLAQQLTEVSDKYNDAISNKKLVFTYADSTAHQVDVSYSNYKNYMNQQLDGLSSSQQKIFLVSTSGKIVVSNIDEMNKVIEDNTEYIKVSDADSTKDYSNYQQITKEDENGQPTQYYVNQKFDSSNFVIIVKDETARDSMLKEKGYEENSSIKNNFVFGGDLNDPDQFQQAIREGIYSFATFGKDDNKDSLVAQEWDTVASGALMEKLDETDDAAAQAQYEKDSNRLELLDKKMQMALDELETERDALKTEMDSIEKIVDDNIQKTFDTFS